MTRTSIIRLAAMAPIALGAVLAAPAAQAAELTTFSCNDERLARRVTTMPITFHKSGDTPISKNFTSQFQARKFAMSAAQTVTTTCELKPDLFYIAEGYDRATGRYKPVNGAYKMAVSCTAKRADGAGYAGIERRLSVPVPTQGGPFDDPAARSAFDTAACQAATSAIRGVMTR